MIAFDAGERNSTKLDAGASARESLSTNKRLVPKRLTLSQHFIELRKIQSSFSKKMQCFSKILYA